MVAKRRSCKARPGIKTREVILDMRPDTYARLLALRARGWSASMIFADGLNQAERCERDGLTCPSVLASVTKSQS